MLSQAPAAGPGSRTGPQQFKERVPEEAGRAAGSACRAGKCRGGGLGGEPGLPHDLATSST